MLRRSLQAEDTNIYGIKVEEDRECTMGGFVVQCDFSIRPGEKCIKK